jgi:hypothetical protein
VLSSRPEEKQVECFAGMRGEVASRSDDLGRPLTVDERDHQGAESGQNLRSLTSPQSRAILAKGDITHVVQAIFNAPMSTPQLQQSTRTGNLAGQVCDAVDDLLGDLASATVCVS